MPIDHLLLHAPRDKFEELYTFYKTALKPLNYSKVFEYPGIVLGLGANNSADFWISVQEGFPSSGAGVHFAFSAPDHATVDAFYEAAIRAGAKDNGKPGIRTMYHESYYAAFVIDPVGNNVEVVHRLDRPSHQ